MSSAAIVLKPSNVNNVDRLTFTLTDNGSAWDLTGSTVTLTTLDPSGTSASHAMTVSDAAGGVVYYDMTWTSAGRWKMTVKVTDASGNPHIYPYPITIVIADQPTTGT